MRTKRLIEAAHRTGGLLADRRYDSTSQNATGTQRVQIVLHSLGVQDFFLVHSKPRLSDDPDDVSQIWRRQEFNLLQVRTNSYSAAGKARGLLQTMLVHAAFVVADPLGFSAMPAKSDEIDVDPNDDLGLSIAKTIHSLEHEYGI
jgi:hypothetical protein